MATIKRTKKKLSSSKTKKRNVVPRTAELFFAKPETFQITWNRALRVISKMRTDGFSLNKASKEVGINPRTVSRLGGRALKKEKNGRYSVTGRDSLLRVVQVPTSDGARDVALRSSRQASILGQYWEAVHKYLRTGNTSELEKFQGKRIKDANSQEVQLITDLKELDRLGSAGVLSFESLYSRAA